ncbi:MAG: heavy metal-binding domain-containing protein [Myxococcota bacterium]|nr:heavy metal-binding domain-containing protein [Myxococcota bacterium]
MVELIVFFGLLVIGYVSGQRRETAHYKRIHEEEAFFADKPAVSAKFSSELDNRDILDAQLAVGSVVVSVDYFKRFIAGIRMLVGGEMKAYASLIDRARREAIIRMKESNPNADIYLNLRLMTSSISSGNANNSLGTVEVVAFATAVRFAPEHDGDDDLYSGEEPPLSS